MKKMIEIKDLHKTYNYKKSNAFEALKGVSLDVEEWEKGRKPVCEMRKSA